MAGDVLNPGDWTWLPATRQAGQVVTKNRLWGTDVALVWLPARGTTVRVTADQVESLERSATSVGPAELVYVAAAARFGGGGVSRVGAICGGDDGVRGGDDGVRGGDDGVRRGMAGLAGLSDVLILILQWQ